MTSSHQRPTPCQSFSRLGSVLDRRSAPRLVLMLVGAVLAHESSRNTIHIFLAPSRIRNSATGTSQVSDPRGRGGWGGVCDAPVRRPRLLSWGVEDSAPATQTNYAMPVLTFPCLSRLSLLVASAALLEGSRSP